MPEIAIMGIVAVAGSGIVFLLGWLAEDKLYGILLAALTFIFISLVCMSELLWGLPIIGVGIYFVLVVLFFAYAAIFD